MYSLADLLISKQAQILEANAKDLAEGTKAGLAKPLLSRLSLTPAKLKSLAVGLKQIADSSHKVKYFFIIRVNELIFSQNGSVSSGNVNLILIAVIIPSFNAIHSIHSVDLNKFMLILAKASYLP